MPSPHVLLVGGYGFFGSRLATRLAQHAGLQLTIAGRSREAADALVARLRPTARAQLDSLALDAMAPSLRHVLAELQPDLVIHASGPFQGQDHRVAEACIAEGMHCVDLADGREFVCGIERLDAAATARGVLIASGASSVPALSSAVVDRLARDMRSVDRIDIGISPGNRTERGLSTMAGVLSYCGKPLPSTASEAGAAKAAGADDQRDRFGWAGTRRHRYPPPVGPRLLSPCDVPDLVLLPPRYAGRPAVRFGAGLELEALHRGMNLMAWAARAGLVRDWSSHAPWLKRIADLFKTFGSDAGAMHVNVTGTDAQGRAVERRWVLVAEHDHGPFVPTLAASALVRKLMAGTLPAAGARPCIGMLSLDDFAIEAKGLDITMTELPTA